MGIAAHFLLLSLRLVSTFREHLPFLFYLLPLIGILTAVTYHHYGKGAEKGNNLIIESTYSDAQVPFRMAIFTFIFTILTHLFGGSAGREGSAVQIGGVLANKIASFLDLDKEQSKQMIHSGISAGFAAVFGTPLAGAFFGMEMVYIGKLERRSLFPCFMAAYIANFVALLLGTTHEYHVIQAIPQISLRTFILVLIAAILFGLFGRLFATCVHALKSFYKKHITNYVLRALLASMLFVIIVVVTNGQKYEGLSLELITDAFAGNVTFLDPAMKLLLTALTLGAGFQGGEVTPLFDIGSSLGGALANIFQITPSFLAALGMIAVFGCAANAPLTTIMLGIDLFGAEAVPYYILVAFVSYLVSGHHGIYSSQIIRHAKRPSLAYHEGQKLSDI